MNNFERFQERNKKRADSTNRGNATFIIKGYNSTVIKNGTTELQAAVVNEQEQNSAYVYTRKDEPLTIGSVWEAKSALHLLITKEIITIKDVEWHKYTAELCNVQVNDLWGRFIGPEETYVNVELKQSSTIISKQKPLIILPEGALAIGDKIIIKGRPWLVQECDNLSTEGIAYYSLTATTASKNDAAENRIETPTTCFDAAADEANHIYGHNIDISVSTEEGYFKYDNTNIKVISRTKTAIVFQLPFGVDEVTIQTKQEGAVVSTTYRAA